MPQTHLTWVMATVFALTYDPALATPPPPIPPPPPGAILFTDEELAKMPAEELAQKLFLDWTHKIVEVRRNEGPAFYTKPILAFADVCQVTRVSFGMEKESRNDPRETIPSYSTGFMIEQLYRYVDPDAAYSPRDGSYFDATAKLCAALGPGLKYFPAPSGLVASFQRQLLRRAVDLAGKAGSFDFKLSCSLHTKEDCKPREILRWINVDEIQRRQAHSPAARAMNATRSG